MVDIGDRPILWHIMKMYSTYGINEFIICLGYKGFLIKEFFANYFLHQSDVTIDLINNKIEVHNNTTEPWIVTLIDTGDNTMTGGRILRIKEYTDNKTFMMTYGDGVSDVNIKKLVEYHKATNQVATLTAVQPSGRFGTLTMDKDNLITKFQEKVDGDGAWVNGGFFVLEQSIFNYLEDDKTIFERGPLQKLTSEKQLKAYYHKGFWMAMDKLSDKKDLEKLWLSDNAPWKIWK